MIRALAVTAGAAALGALALLAPGREAALPAAAGVAPRELPEFRVPRLAEPQRMLSATDLRGDVTLLNVWATWCVPCRQEHGVLLAIAGEPGVRIVGLNYRDRREDALRWLEQLGNPYAAVGHDGDGRAAGTLGVAGAPETYVLDAAGRIVHRHVGVLTLDAWRSTLAPLVATLRDRGTG